MVRNVLILDNGGRVLVDHTHREALPIERDLVGGFISALSLFGQETFGEQVQEIKFSKRRLLLQRTKYCYVVAITDLDDDIAGINKIMQGISKKLRLWHKDNLSKGKFISQQTINWIKQMINHFVPHLQSFESNTVESSQQKISAEKEAKIKADKFPLKKARFDIKALARESIQAMRPVLEAQRHEIILKIPENLPEIEGDIHRLAHVFKTLLENAKKFTPAGGRIKLCIQEMPSLVLIEVSDTGIGINPENLERIFDGAVDIEFPDPTGGTDLGLFIARKIVIRHGGWLWAESEGEGKGVTFFFTIPK